VEQVEPLRLHATPYIAASRVRQHRKSSCRLAPTQQLRGWKTGAKEIVSAPHWNVHRVVLVAVFDAWYEQRSVVARGCAGGPVGLPSLRIERSVVLGHQDRDKAKPRERSGDRFQAPSSVV
jgi:hypothetical protein